MTDFEEMRVDVGVGVFVDVVMIVAVVVVVVVVVVGKIERKLKSFLKEEREEG